MEKPEEKWEWLQDLTKGRGGPSISNVESDEFDDAEVASKEKRNQGDLLNRITNGFEWMRAEERIGRWLGLVAAVLIWGTLFLTWYQSHPINWDNGRNPDDFQPVTAESHDQNP